MRPGVATRPRPSMTRASEEPGGDRLPTQEITPSSMRTDPSRSSVPASSMVRTMSQDWISSLSMHQPLGCARHGRSESAKLRARCPGPTLQASGCNLHRVNNLLIAGAATEVPGQSLADRLLCRRRMVVQKIGDRYDQPGRTESTLHGASFQKRFLDGVKTIALRERFYRAYLPALGLRRQHQTGTDQFLIQPYRARSALALLTRVLGAHETQVVTEQREQAGPRPHIGLAGVAVDVQTNQHGWFSAPTASLATLKTDRVIALLRPEESGVRSTFGHPAPSARLDAQAPHTRAGDRRRF